MSSSITTATAIQTKATVQQMTVPECLTLMNHPRPAKLPTSYQRILESPDFKKKAMVTRILCVTRVRRFIRSLAPLHKGECTICWESRVVYALHDKDYRHGVCRDCRYSLMQHMRPCCPLCRAQLGVQHHTGYLDRGARMDDLDMNMFSYSDTEDVW